jgi:menaquinone-dependent protoporphyrinogen oxidase
MAKRVLVVYGSKHGATAEIAERIGATLRAAGLGVDVADARQAAAPAGYDAVVLGSAVYIGAWRREAARYLTQHEAALQGLPVWLFSSGPTQEGDPAELAGEFGFPKRLRPVADRIAPRNLAIFHGVNDLAKLSGIERWMMKQAKAQAGDFRDWAAIEAWARGIVTALA